MRWLIGVTLAWFAVINIANLKNFLKFPHFPNNNLWIWVAILGLLASVIGLAGLIFGWGI